MNKSFDGFSLHRMGTSPLGLKPLLHQQKEGGSEKHWNYKTPKHERKSVTQSTVYHLKNAQDMFGSRCHLDSDIRWSSFA